jgi:palmitoyltransferase ZDHHC6
MAQYLFSSRPYSQATSSQANDTLIVDDDGQVWPPQDPLLDRDDSEFVLPSNPWTYKNGALNPNLQPSNAQRRSTRTKRRRPRGGSVVPPYHPDFQHSPSSSQYASSSDSEDIDCAGPRIRRGSEGYEVQTIDREEMLRRFIENRTLEEGRYNVYVPESGPDSSESEPTSSTAESNARNEAALRQ